MCGPQQVVHRRNVEIEFSGILWFEVAAFDLYRHIATEFKVVEQKVDVKILVLNLNMVLVADEREACTKLQKQFGDVFDQFAFNFALDHPLTVLDEIKNVRVFQRLFGKFALWTRQAFVEVCGFRRDCLALVQPVFDLMHENIA